MKEHSDTVGILISIATFGSLGALSRYALSFLPVYFGIPVGTAVVNIVGSFLLGILSSATLHPSLPLWVQLGFGTGFLGAFTTFSTFSVENAKLIQEQAYLSAGINIAGQLFLGITMALLGLYVGSKCLQP